MPHPHTPLSPLVTEYPNLFPGLEEALRAEAYLAAQRRHRIPSVRFPEFEGKHLQVR